MIRICGAVMVACGLVVFVFGIRAARRLDSGTLAAMVGLIGAVVFAAGMMFLVNGDGT